MARVVDRTTLLEAACELGEGIYRRCGELEAKADSDEQHIRLAGIPLNARWVDQADSILFFSATKTACILGRVQGEGFLIARLPSQHPSLIRWSPPCFVHIHLLSVGLSLGRQWVESFMPCMTPDLRRMLSGAAGGRSVTGLDAAIDCGGLQHKADLIAVPTGSVGTVGINHTSGLLLDLSFATGSLTVDAPKNALVYGPEVTALQVLHGTVAAPREMQPLYATLNAELSTVERVTPPARVSASLERMTAGFDPDRRMVMPDGSVIREDLREAPKKDKAS